MSFLNATDPYIRYVLRDVKNNAFDVRNVPGAVRLEGSLGGPVLDALQDYANKVAQGSMPNSESVLNLIENPQLRWLASIAMYHLDSRRN